MENSISPKQIRLILITSAVFGFALAAGLIWIVAFHLSPMSSQEKYLAARLGDKLPPIINSVSCDAQDASGRECTVTFASDMQSVPSQKVVLPPRASGYPRDSFVLQHDVERGENRFVESNVVLVTTIDTSRVESRDALAWIDSLQSEAVAAAASQAESWLSVHSKPGTAAASYQ